MMRYAAGYQTVYQISEGIHVPIVPKGDAIRLVHAAEGLAVEVGTAYAAHWARPEHTDWRNRNRLHHQYTEHFAALTSLVRALYARIEELEAEQEWHRGA